MDPKVKQEYVKSLTVVVREAKTSAFF